LTFFAISDLHLPAKEKPMDVFGVHWENHFERIREDWLAQVRDEDVVMLPGDLTWAMRLEDALEDLAQIDALPGTKVLLKGNHDYWWSSIGRVRRSLSPKTLALQNDHIMLNGILIAGSRGWSVPPEEGADEEDVRIYKRERLRLEMSLKAARKENEQATLIAMMHFPPCPEGMGRGFSDLLQTYGVSHCVYGHLHGAGLTGAVKGMKEGILYHQVSCDGLGFKLYKVLEQ